MESAKNPTVIEARTERAKHSILVVEDDPLVRQVSVGLLKVLGYRTLEAHDGSSALLLLNEIEQIDLLFTDIMMPGGMTGFQLAEAARKKFPRLRIVFTSGYNEENLTRLFSAGPNARLLRKPFELRELTKVMEEALKEDS